MKWLKKGLIYQPDGSQAWAKSHAMVPTPDCSWPDRIRIYLTFCDEKGIGRVGYVDLNRDDPTKIIRVSTNPVLDIGQPGTFDESGVLQTSIVNLPDGRKYLYYAGFELGTQVRYRLLAGLAISEDGGETFKRIQRTPLLERSDHELYFRGGPFVIVENNVFKLWYVAGSEWMDINGKAMPVYTINYQESKDGITWGKQGKICIAIGSTDEHGFGRPYVYKENNLYKMFYSIRYNDRGYRIGYAESRDGIVWTRKDNEAGIDITETHSWENKTVCYAAIVKIKEKTYMFYNGNEFGKTGFGYAVLEQ